MRLIDADALLEKMKKTDRYFNIVFDIEDAPTVGAVKATMPWTNPDGTETMLDEVSYEIGYSQGQGEWIPCSERMPEEDYCTGRGVQYSESVLVTVINHGNDDDVFVDMACTADGEWQLNYPQDDNPFIPKWCDVVAWMPLPKPWKGAENETN